MKPWILECFSLLAYANIRFILCSNYETLNSIAARDSKKQSSRFGLELEPGCMSKCLIAPLMKDVQQNAYVLGRLDNHTELYPGVSSCLLDIEKKNSLGQYRSEEAIVFEYYACIINVELRVLADLREQRKLHQYPLKGNWLAKDVSILANATKCLVIVAILIAFRRYIELSFLNVVEELRSQSCLLMTALDLRINALASNVSNLETSMGTKLQKLRKRVKVGVQSSLETKTVSILSKENMGNTEKFPAIEKNCVGRQAKFVDEFSICSHESGGDEPSGDFGLPLQRSEHLPLELASKKKGLLFDLTTKKGRNDWKEYINRDIRRIAAHQINAAGQSAIVKSSVDCNSGGSKENDVLDDTLQNVPLYDRHGKPLRRICVPGIGWISRKKYLEQRG
ncbi:hypothetical protein ACU8KH_02294 [Lachancea thermotolerans]